MPRNPITVYHITGDMAAEAKQVGKYMVSIQCAAAFLGQFTTMGADGVYLALAVVDDFGNLVCVES